MPTRLSIEDPSSLPLDVQIEQIRQELAGRGERPPSSDKVMGACAVALANLFSYPEVTDRVADILTHRKSSYPHEHLPTWAIAHMLTTSSHGLVHKQLIKNRQSYSARHETPETWEKILRMMLKVGQSYDPEDLVDDFSYGPSVFGLQTIKLNREAPMKALAHAKAHQTGQPIVRYDVGSSRGDTLIMFRDNLPLSPIEIVRGQDNLAASTALNGLLSRPAPPIGRLTGVEQWLVRPTDPLRFDWFTSNYLRPADLRDHQKRRLFNELGKRCAGLEIIEADFSFPLDKLKEAGLDSPHDICSFSSSLYSDDPKTQLEMINNGLDLGKENSWIVIQDFVKVSPVNPYALHFTDRIDEDFSYRTYVLDVDEPDKGYQEFARWQDGSCKVMKIGDSDFSRRVWSSLGVVA